jgi:hypothetical protein
MGVELIGSVEGRLSRPRECRRNTGENDVWLCNYSSEDEWCERFDVNQPRLWDRGLYITCWRKLMTEYPISDMETATAYYGRSHCGT